MFFSAVSSLRMLAAAALGSACLGAGAAPVAPPIRAEIDGLMSAMHASACRFERNGKWHSAGEAQAHLLRKLAYIEKRKETLASTEQFIALAASQSSLSGKPYRVMCGNGEAVESRVWLNRQLKTLRSAKP